MKQEYSVILRELPALLKDTRYDISILSNACALLNMHMKDINWVGFYLLKDNQLILGPFQGKPACTVIPIGKGVCGTCIAKKESIAVSDVHRFPGHIACDTASKSELCIPLYRGQTLYGLLDIDSFIANRFTDDDIQPLEEIVKIIETALNAEIKD